MMLDQWQNKLSLIITKIESLKWFWRFVCWNENWKSRWFESFDVDKSKKKINVMRKITRKNETKNDLHVKLI